MASQERKLGVSRVKRDVSLIEPEDLPFGGVSLRGLVGGKKFTFTWDLWLPLSKLLVLKAIIEEHAYRVENRLADFDIRLVDTRLPIQERDPRTRAKSGDLIVTQMPVTGYSLFYPQFNISLSPPEIFLDDIWGDLSDDTYYSFQLEGQETSLVPITEDIP